MNLVLKCDKIDDPTGTTASTEQCFDATLCGIVDKVIVELDQE